jgi:1-acyl-sn-glycerol-3-phosphate acyltransferase
MKPTRKLLYLLYRPYQWLIFFPLFFINTLIFGVIAVVFSSLVNQRIGSYFGGVVWSRFNAFMVPMFVKVSGKKNIKPGTSYIVIPNHQSYFDVFLIYGWLGLDIKWVMKKELHKIPGLGFGSEKVGHIFIDRSNNRAAIDSLAKAKKRLVNGTSVVIFPEGTRSETGKTGDFKRGAFKLAIELGLPILPVTVINTKNILPANSLNIMPGKVSMVIHEPVDISLYTEDMMAELILRVKTIIISALPKTY